MQMWHHVVKVWKKSQTVTLRWEEIRMFRDNQTTAKTKACHTLGNAGIASLLWTKRVLNKKEAFAPK